MPDEVTELTGTGDIDDLIANARLEAEAEAETETPPDKPKRTRTTRARGNKKDLTEPLTQLYGSIGAGVFMLNHADGAVILANAETMAQSLNEWGNADPRIRKVLEKLCTTSAIGQVVAAHAPVILAIVNNHNLIPKFGNENADQNQTDRTHSGNSANGVSPPSGYPTGPVGRPVGVTPVVVAPR